MPEPTAPARHACPPRRVPSRPRANLGFTALYSRVPGLASWIAGGTYIMQPVAYCSRPAPCLD
jgi:hypothetical protein